MSSAAKVQRISLRIPFKATVWYTLSSVITKGITMLSTPLFTRLMSESDYSLFPLYLTWLGLIGALCAQDSSGVVSLAGMQRFYEEKEEFIKSAMGFNSLIIGVICILYFAFYPLLRKISAIGAELSMILFLQLAADSVIHIFLGKWRFSYKYKPVFFTNVAMSLTSAVFALAIVRLTEFDAVARSVGLLLSSLPLAIILFIRILRLRGRFFNRKMWAFLTKVTLPMIPQYFASALLLGADRIMILRYYGRVALAKYSVAHSLGASVCFITTGMSFALKPWILRKLKEHTPEKIANVIQVSLPILSVAALSLVAFSPEIMRFLAPVEYSDSLFAVLPIALSVVPSFLSSVISTALAYHGKTARSALPAAACALINILLNALLFSKFSYTVAAVTSLLCSALTLLFGILAYKRSVGEELFRFVKSSSVFLISLPIGLLLLFCRDSLILRVLITASLLVAVSPLARKAFELIKE